jgi:hypothetical protein
LLVCSVAMFPVCGEKNRIVRAIVVCFL